MYLSLIPEKQFF